MPVPVPVSPTHIQSRYQPTKRRTNSATRTPTRSPSPYMTTPTSPTPQQQPPSPQALRKRTGIPEPLKLHSNGSANGHANGRPSSFLSKLGQVRSDKEATTPLPSPTTPGGTIIPAHELKKVDWEIPRKTLHSSIGFLVLPLYVSQHSVQSVIFGLALTLVFVSSNDLIRFNWPAFARAYEQVVGFLMRESERHKINGVVWYLVGVLFVLLAFPLDIAVVSILTLSWADTTASTVGRMFGRRTSQLPTSFPIPGTSIRLPLFAPKKSVAGFTAAVVTGACITAGFFGGLAPLGVEEPAWAWGKGVLGNWAGLVLTTVVGGMAAGVSEALYVGPLDDNLTLPILTGTTLWAFFQLERVVSALILGA